MRYNLNYIIKIDLDVDSIGRFPPISHNLANILR